MRKMINIMLVILITFAVAGIYISKQNKSKQEPQQSTVVEDVNKDVDWCVVCPEQKDAYYRFCLVEHEGEITINGMDIFEFCKLRAKHEVEICLMEGCPTKN
jgi:biopolymer transport protein ExbD